MLDERGIRQTIDTVRPYSMVCDEGLRFTISEAIETVRRNIHGHYVE